MSLDIDAKGLGACFGLLASLLDPKRLGLADVDPKGLLALAWPENGLGFEAVESVEKNFDGAGVDVGVVDS